MSLLHGCVLRPGPDCVDQTVTRPGQVHLGDDSLRRVLTIGPEVVGYDRHGLMTVEVPVHNDGRSDLQLEAQFVFLGPYGVATNDKTARRTFTVSPSGTHQIQACARTSSAADYRLYLWNVE
ncbi:MAG: DUF1425 domain-containing protein [Planctomycetota bacterium]